MAKRYWHTLADSTIKKLISKHTTWDAVMERYRQPSWCGYPNALEGILGCWSLTDHKIRHEISREYCTRCDCFIKKEEK
jgi:hypothetical protein